MTTSRIKKIYMKIFTPRSVSLFLSHAGAISKNGFSLSFGNPRQPSEPVPKPHKYNRLITLLLCPVLWAQNSITEIDHLPYLLKLISNDKAISKDQILSKGNDLLWFRTLGHLKKKTFLPISHNTQRSIPNGLNTDSQIHSFNKYWLSTYYGQGALF